MTAIRLGVLGGSFNPIHLGHLHIARRTRGLFGLSRVLFVVACTPPHKQPHDLISFNHRYAMVSLATSGCEYFHPSPVELESPVSPYSIDTLAKLARRFGIAGHALHFIAGGDSLLEVAGWHRGAELLLTYTFVFAMRPGFLVPDIEGILPARCAWAPRGLQRMGLSPRPKPACRGVFILREPHLSCGCGRAGDRRVTDTPARRVGASHR